MRVLNKQKEKEKDICLFVVGAGLVVLQITRGGERERETYTAYGMVGIF